jgi:ubiquinone/menaquinone biosynthesis C-methylase UbiE
MQPREHWQKVYTTKAPTEVSWFQEHATLSMQLIRQAGVPPEAAIIDVGGGASRLVEDLIGDGRRNITVLDFSGAALAAARMLLGPDASDVKWIEADVLEAPLAEHAYDVWHDRAVFHFLVSPADRRKYVGQALRAVKPGGFLVMATFAEDGPLKCSGLETMRYTPDELKSELGDPFTLLAHERESHSTPSGNVQRFVYCLFRR